MTTLADLDELKRIRAEQIASDITGLPEVAFAPDQPEPILAEMIAIHEANTNKVVYPASYEALIFKTIAEVLTRYNVRTDIAGKNTLLRYALDGFLENLGALVKAPRIQPLPASCIVRFTLLAPLSFPAVIPQGRRVTNGSVYFATDKFSVIEPGDLSVEVSATSLAPGASSNGFLPGQITTLADPLPFVVTVENITTTAGGSDKEDLDRYRLRVFIALEAFSTAGPKLAYAFHSLTAHTNILDVNPYMPTPGVARMVLLLNDGVIPDVNGPEVRAVLNVLLPGEDDIRPFTDCVEVVPATAVGVEYVLSWFITRQQSGFYDAIEANIKKAVEEYNAWQQARIGRDINPQELISLCRAAGAKRIRFDGLRRTVINQNEVAQIESFSILPGQVEDE